MKNTLFTYHSKVNYLRPAGVKKGRPIGTVTITKREYPLGIYKNRYAVMAQ